MLHISSLSIPARGKTSRLTVNCLPIFSIWFENCRAQAVRAGESGIRLLIAMRIGRVWDFTGSYVPSCLTVPKSVDGVGAWVLANPIDTYRFTYRSHCLP